MYSYRCTVKFRINTLLSIYTRLSYHCGSYNTHYDIYIFMVQIIRERNEPLIWHCIASDTPLRVKHTANSCQLQTRVLPRLYILFPRVNILGWFCSPLELEHIQINDITRAHVRSRAPTVRVYVRDRET